MHNSAATIYPGAIIETASGDSIIRSVKEQKSGCISITTIPVHNRVTVIRQDVPLCWWSATEMAFPADQAPGLDNIVVDVDGIRYLVTARRNDNGIAYCKVAEL